MSNKRAYKPAASPSSAMSYSTASVLIAERPAPVAQPRARVRTTATPVEKEARKPAKAPKTRTRRPDLTSVVRSLLDAGDDVEATIARVNDALRDAMGWDDVSFWPAEDDVHTLGGTYASHAIHAHSADASLTTPVDRATFTLESGLRERVFASGEPAFTTDISCDAAPCERDHGARGGRRSRAPYLEALPQQSQVHAQTLWAVSGSGRPRSAFVFPIRGTNGILGVIECRSSRPQTPEVAGLGAAAALGGDIGLFIERHAQATGRRVSAAGGQIKHAEAEPSATQMQAVFEAMADSVLVFDRDGRILQTNAADRDLLGRDARLTRLPMTIYERGHMLKLRDDQEWPLADERSPYLRVLGGETLSGQDTAELVLCTLDGRDVDVSISGAPIYDADGVLIGGVVVTRDVSRRRRSERELQEANRRLEEFLAVAAHELRTPATSSIGYIQLASKRVERLADVATAENADLSASIGNVRGNLVDAELGTQRLARLVDRLLDVARIRASKLELSPQPVNLAALVDTSVHEHRLANPTRIIRCDLPMTGWVSATADPDRIEQALANYLANALRYSPPDRPVEVELTVNDREARVIVRDGGPGIPESEQERIWSSYEQGEGARQQISSNAGLGLGLYISRAIVEAHGGHVGVESALGHGSTFWFSLPLAHTDA